MSVGRRLEGRQPGGDAPVDRVDGRVASGCCDSASRRELGRLARPHEDGLRAQAGGQAGHHEIVAFDQEGALALAVLADAQRRRSFDERVLGAREGG